jgi:hypothetical protein
MLRSSPAFLFLLRTRPPKFLKLVPPRDYPAAPSLRSRSKKKLDPGADYRDINLNPSARSGSGISPPPSAPGVGSSVFYGSSACSLFAKTSTSEVFTPVPPKDDPAAPSVRSRSKKKRGGHKKGSCSERTPRVGSSELTLKTLNESPPKGLFPRFRSGALQGAPKDYYYYFE